MATETAPGDSDQTSENEFYTIEASVVTGFEECARGEAKERFGCDVKATRGKITWKMPLERVKEIPKMGSIDNFRVVMHSIPHFKFTDQHDSLARLQQMIVDVDWESGLAVWKEFNNFPHAIAHTPEKIPSPEELVDVVVFTRLPQSTKDKSEKKNRKGGRGKKKEKKKGSKNKDEKIQTEQKDLDIEANEVEGETSCSESAQKTPDGSQKTVSETVIVKPKISGAEEAKIDIKVLIPGPDHDAFPQSLSEMEQRNVEPMEVDTSLLNNSVNQTPSETPKKTQPLEIGAGDFCKPSAEITESEKPSPNEDLLNRNESDFASSVIERLNSPTKLSAPTACTTPPSTPVTSVEALSFRSPVSKASHSGQSDGSSVDPKYFDAVLGVNDTTPIVPSVVSPCDPSSGVSAQSNAEIEPEKTGSESKSEETPPTVRVRDPTKPTFRVTCNRVGESHPFDSTSAAATFGSAVITYFGWSVDLKNFDIEVMLNIDNEEVTVCLGLSKTSLHNRNLVAFGPTTLRATICYNMLRLCRIKNGDFICDPMCGTSALPIEGAVNWVNCFHFGGDFHEKAIERTSLNIAGIQEKMKQEKKKSLKLDAVQWNIEQFPLRDKCVDVFVSDLPFGHRMGSRSENRTLYPSLLTEMARCARVGARACLLTEDKTSLIKAIQAHTKYWQRRLVLSINIGGLSGFVFLLTRTTAAIAPKWTSWRQSDTAETNSEKSSSDNAALVEDSVNLDRQQDSGDSTLGAASIKDTAPSISPQECTVPVDVNVVEKPLTDDGTSKSGQASAEDNVS